MVASGFSHVHYLLIKQKNTLNIEGGDLWLTLTNLLCHIRDVLGAHQNPSLLKKN